MEGITNSYLQNAIQNLVSTIGIKDCINDRYILFSIFSNKIKKGIEEIAKHLGLPITINLSYVSSQYTVDKPSGFNSTDLAKTDWMGRGTEGITAQISIPRNLPSYGSSAFNNLSIDVRVSENCRKNPATFTAIMAHELSHIVLYSIFHEEKDNEVYTDIAAMMLGFADTIKRGRKVVKTIDNLTSRETQTTTYGYLSDNQFNFVYREIKKELKKYQKAKKQLFKKNKKLRKKIKSVKRKIFYFQKYLMYLDKKSATKINEKDGFFIVGFHKTGYLDESKNTVNIALRRFKDVHSFINNLYHYNKQHLQQIKQYEEKVKSLTGRLNSVSIKLHKDICILSKYIFFGYKLKLFLKSLYNH